MKYISSLILLFFIVYPANGFVSSRLANKISASRTSINIINYRYPSVRNKKVAIFGKVSPAREEEREEIMKDETDDDGNTVAIPYTGMAGYKRGNLYNKPLEIYNPVNDMDNLPGEPGSEERRNAMFERIQKRVDELKASGQYEYEYRDVKSPVLTQSEFLTAWQIVKSIKPWQQADELGLSMLLSVVVLFTFSSYLYFVREVFEKFMTWFIDTDFDSDFLPNLLNSITSNNI
eukprot:gene10887-14613_t